MEISASFILFLVSAAFTPGPNNLMIMSSGLNHGVRASLPHLMGIVLGVPTMFLAVGFGLSRLFEAVAWLHSLVQVLGVLYLLYMAWLIAISASSSLEAQNDAKPFTFIQAALFQWINPKAWMMGTGAIAAFSKVGVGLGTQVFTMALLFCLVALPSAGAWLIFGSWLKRLFSDVRYLVLFNRIMAGLLVLSVLPVIKDMLSQ